MQPVIYALDTKERTRLVARSMQEGFERHGVAVPILTSYDGVVGDLAIAYGWSHELVFKAYPNFVYWDLGYWDRRPKGNKKDGYHRLSVNHWDTAKLMLAGMPGDRLRSSYPGLDLKPWGSKGRSIILAGMSGKAAKTHGYLPNQWENVNRAHLSTMTTRPIIVREKPTGENPQVEPIEAALSHTHMLVTHHSNTAIDALIAGVPFYCVKGVGRRLSMKGISPSMIEHPPRIDDQERQQLLQDVAYCQWRPSEMRNGQAWEHIQWMLRSSLAHGKPLNDI